MPKIPEFDAGSGKLEVDQSGAQALGRAATQEARYAAQTAAVMKETGQLYKQGIDAVGKGIEQYTDQAQAHNDAMAETDFDAQQIASTAAAKGAVTEAGTPTTAAGEPITDSVGVGGEKSLPVDANVPTPQSFEKAATTAVTQHQVAGQTFLDKLTGQGVSQKMQDHLAMRQQKYQAELAAHTGAVASEVATTHVVQQTDSVLRGLLSDTNQHPENIDANLDHGYDAFQTLRGHGTGDAAKSLEDQATKGEAAYREAAVKAAYEGVARKGGDASIDAATKLMDKYPNDVKDRAAGLTEINRLASQQNANLERQQRQEERDQAIKIDGASASAFENSKLPATDPKAVKDPYAEVQKQFHGNDLIAAEHELDLLGKDRTNPVPKEISSQTAMDIQSRIDAGTLNRTDADAELQKAWDHREINKQDYQQSKRYSAQSETSEGKWLISHTNDWLKNNEGRIDPNLGAGPLPGGKSILGQQQVQAWKEELNRRYAADPVHGHDLLDPTKQGNMVSNEALAKYRVTDAMTSAHDAQKDDLDAAADKARGVPSEKNWFQNLFGSGTPDKTATPEAPAKDAEGRIGGPGMPVQTPSMGDMMGKGIFSKDAGITYVLKNYQPGTQFKDPQSGEVREVPKAGTTFVVDGKSYTVPGKAAAAPASPTAPKKMSYSPEPNAAHTPFGVGTPNAPMGAAASGAIKASTLDGLDAHSGKNLFSSGAAAAMGINGGVGQNLVSIGKDPGTGNDVKVNAQAAPHFQAFLEDLKGRGYQINSLGGYVNREKRGGSTTSEHAYGNAIDINPGKNEFRSSKTNLPANIGAIAAQYGLIWGGDWRGGSRDNMHFEWSGKS